MSAKSTSIYRVFTIQCVIAVVMALPPLALASELLKVNISGLSGEPLANAQAALSIVKASTEKTLSADIVREAHGKAEGEIRRALEPFGYYRPAITAELTREAGKPSAWNANYIIDAGLQLPIEAIDVQFTGPGSDEDILRSLPDKLALREQTALDHSYYEIAKASFLRRIKDQGFLDAAYEVHRVEVDLETYTARVILHVTPGPRYVFGPIVLEQDQFASDYLQRYLILKPGEPFSQAEVSRQRSALSRSGHFQEVAVKLGETTHETQAAVPVHIRLVPYKANRYRAGVGWGSDTGFGLQADWTRRYIGKHGHHFNLGGAVAEERNRLAGDLSYMIPLDPFSGHSIELAARHESKDLTYKDVDLDEGGDTRIATNIASILWHLPEKTLGNFELSRTGALGFVGETYDVFEVLFGNLPSDSQQAIIDAIGQEAYDILSPDFEAVVPTLRFTLRNVDNPLYIRRGDYYSLQLLGAAEAMGSNISFWQAKLSTWNIWPVADSGRLLLRSTLGYSDADSSSALGVNFNQMPEYYEFRAGGARSVRGYGFETLIPSDTITGGKHLAVASIEYEHEIIPDWSVAVFLDGGNAFNDFDNIDEKLGTGVGIRWRSPVGVARIDLGFPLDDADDSFQIYITVGPEF